MRYSLVKSGEKETEPQLKNEIHIMTIFEHDGKRDLENQGPYLQTGH